MVAIADERGAEHIGIVIASCQCTSCEGDGSESFDTHFLILIERDMMDMRNSFLLGKAVEVLPFVTYQNRLS